MSIDEQHVALPQLYGAPAYARPPKVVEPVRPFDPDELPIEAERTDEERRIADPKPARSGATKSSRHSSSSSAAPLAFTVRKIAGKIIGGG